jgi:hypothetical protein
MDVGLLAVACLLLQLLLLLRASGVLEDPVTQDDLCVELKRSGCHHNSVHKR